MGSTIRSRFACLVCIAILAMSMIAAGCGTDEDGRIDDYAGRIRKERSTEKPVAQPPVDQTPVSVEPVQPVNSKISITGRIKIPKMPNWFRVFLTISSFFLS